MPLTAAQRATGADILRYLDENPTPAAPEQTLIPVTRIIGATVISPEGGTWIKIESHRSRDRIKAVVRRAGQRSELRAYGRRSERSIGPVGEFVKLSREEMNELARSPHWTVFKAMKRMEESALISYFAPTSTR